MRVKILAVGAAILAGTAFAPGPAVAAAFSGAQGSQAVGEADSMIEEVGRRRHGHRHRGHGHRHHGHRHRHFRHHHRHFRPRHFHHRPYPYVYPGAGYGYGFYGRCERARYTCGDYWGWGTWEYENCLMDRGC